MAKYFGACAEKTGMKYIFFLFVLTSCATSTMVQSPHHKSKYAPKNYAQTGTMKYLAQGADSIIEARREDAFKAMWTQCGGEYEITREYRDKDNISTQANAFGGHNVNHSNYVYMDFKCLGVAGAMPVAEDQTPKRECNFFGKILASQGCN
jgi:hypothetical protein